MGIRNRFVVVTMAAVAATAMVGAATAAAAPAGPPASATDRATDHGTKKGGDDKKGADRADIAKVAAGLGVSVRRLTTALDNLKKALGKGADKAAAVDAFARELGVPRADAEKALQALSAGGGKKPGDGKEKPGVPDEVVTLLAAELHVSTGAARQVFKDLEQVTAKDAVTDPVFIAIAKKLGVTPQRLLDALVKVKQEYGKQHDKGGEAKAPSGSTAK